MIWTEWSSQIIVTDIFKAHVDGITRYNSITYIYILFYIQYFYELFLYYIYTLHMLLQRVTCLWLCALEKNIYVVREKSPAVENLQKKHGRSWNGVCFGLSSHKTTTRCWFQTFFIFTPKLGEDEPILTNIFQRGWNHQPDNFLVSKYMPTAYLSRFQKGSNVLGRLV